ncbi:MAG TPA: glycosyltransferase family 2 protein [Acidimicrobiales bacterium]|nr:glycosyltransferase family 2 protein [Acidimicrobiales bacterium]
MRPTAPPDGLAPRAGKGAPAPGAGSAGPRPDVGAVIVNYNAGDHLLACVASLRVEGVDQIVVVDNGSVDGSCRALQEADPAVRVLCPGANLGYGAGANLGIGEITSELVLVGNPDIVVQPGAVAALAATLAGDPALGVVGPRVEEADGSLYPSARTFPSLVDALGHGFLGMVAPGNPFSRRYTMADWDHADAREVDWVSGACFLARRSVLETLQGFDEAYFMYSEDVDLCWRTRQAGWRVAFQPAAGVSHIQGVSAEHHPYRMILAHHRSLLRFASRTTTGWQRGLLPAMAAGLGLRAGLVALDRWRADGVHAATRGGRRQL